MKRWLLPILFVLFALLFLISVWLLADYYLASHRNKDQFAQLAQIMAQSTLQPEPSATKLDGEALPPEETAPAGPVYVTVTNPETGEQSEILPEFARLYGMNEHIVGWLSIDDTGINYPVMQTPDTPNYYLYTGFDRQYSRHGCIYVRETCDVFTPSDNVTIYGHRMGDGTMFNALHDYADPEFYDAHRYITFNTLKERHTYEILCVFRISSSVGHPFQFQEFTNAADAAEFADYIRSCKSYALYDTGVTAEYGDKLITLATCEYTQVNGRLVVVAKRVT